MKSVKDPGSKVAVSIKDTSNNGFKEPNNISATINETQGRNKSASEVETVDAGGKTFHINHIHV